MKSRKSTESPAKSRSTLRGYLPTGSGTASTNVQREPQNMKSSLPTTNENLTMPNESQYASTLQSTLTLLSVSLALLELSKSSIGSSDSSPPSCGRCSKLLADIVRTSCCKPYVTPEELLTIQNCLDGYSIDLTGKSSSQSLAVSRIRGL